MTIIFDFNRTLFDPESKKLFPGVIDMLTKLKNDNRLILITRKEGQREDLIEKLGLKELFERIVLTDKKTVEAFTSLIAKNDRTIVVGDRLVDEITIGNQLGCTTIHLKQGKFADDQSPVKPHFTIQAITELLPIIKNL